MPDEPVLDPEILDSDMPLEADPADALEQRQEVPYAEHEELVLDESGERLVDERRGLSGFDL